MNRCLKRIALTAILASSALLGVAAPASADTVTMGSTLTNPFDSPGQAISAPTVTAQIGFDPGTSPNPVVSPANGVITGWKMKSADDGALYTLKVLRPTGSVTLVPMTFSDFMAVGSIAAPSAIPAGTAVSDPQGKVFDYPASLPISKGDYIGVLSSGAVSDIPQHTTGGVPLNLTSNNFEGKPADGTTAALQADEQHDLLLQATIRYCNVPALKGLKRAAAQQALATADCALGKVKKKKLKRSKKTKKKKGKVLKQSLAPGSTAAPGTVVDLKIAGLRKKSKKS